VDVGEDEDVRFEVINLDHGFYSEFAYAVLGFEGDCGVEEIGVGRGLPTVVEGAFGSEDSSESSITFELGNDILPKGSTDARVDGRDVVYDELGFIGGDGDASAFLSPCILGIAIYDSCTFVCTEAIVVRMDDTLRCVPTFGRDFAGLNTIDSSSVLGVNIASGVVEKLDEGSFACVVSY
jgi:hypothetical protein